jgi:hypothetical protein
MRRTIVVHVVVSLLMFVGGSAVSAWSGVCGDSSGPGGTDAPCHCGDTVTTNTMLDASDPVTTIVCACTGLIVPSGVVLDLGGRTITGSGDCVGVDIGGAFAGFDAVVRNGQVTRFGTGVLALGEARHNLVHDIRLIGNSNRGVFLLGPGTVVEDCVVSGTGGPGITLDVGNDPPGGGVVQRCRVEDSAGNGIEVGGRLAVAGSNIARRNAGHGIVVGGNANTVTLNRVEDNQQSGLVVFGGPPELGLTSVTRNVASRNRGTGVQIDGDSVLVDRNQSKYNDGEGFEIGGGGHTVTLNIAVTNEENGFVVSATDTTLERNTANYNGRAHGSELADGYGIVDTTAATMNWYSGNGCTGNGLGNSLPRGLCF